MGAKRLDMQVRRVAIGDVFTDPANVRKHDARNVNAIIGSLKQFGQVEPLVVLKKTGKVIGGNGRLEAMRQMGMTHVEIAEVELTETQATALGIALNRTAELAEWDYEALGGLLRSLQADEFDLSSIGYEGGDLENLLAAEFKAPELEDLPEDPDEEKPLDEGGTSIRLTAEQTEIFRDAKKRISVLSGEALSDGGALQLIAADYLTRHKE